MTEKNALLDTRLQLAGGKDGNSATYDNVLVEIVDESDLPFNADIKPKCGTKQASPFSSNKNHRKPKVYPMTPQVKANKKCDAVRHRYMVTSEKIRMR